jgi:hypothetical protein
MPAPCERAGDGMCIGIHLGTTFHPPKTKRPYHSPHDGSIDVHSPDTVGIPMATPDENDAWLHQCREHHGTCCKHIAHVVCASVSEMMIIVVTDGLCR